CFMSLEYSCILPHGFNLIPDLNPEQDEKSAKLALEISSIAEQIVNKDPEVIIIASPHNLRISENIGIVTTEWLKGSYIEKDTEKSAEMEWKCDRKHASKLYIRAKNEGLPVVAVNFGTSEGPLSSIPLDWGTFIPLYFIKKAYEKSKKTIPQVVLITPSRDIDWKHLVKLGELIYLLSIEENKKTVFIASADQAHAHDANGPYGFDPAAKSFDDLICKMITSNSLNDLLGIDQGLIEHSKPDSLWQILILAGIAVKANMVNKSCVYECPTYYGMIAASFERKI
ncbi:MAG: hypothetical protein ACTSPJ_09570, partial [Candidatus Heimdallarchaeaceae archaeon]